MLHRSLQGRVALLRGTFIPLLAALVVVLVAAPLATGLPLVSAMLVSVVLIAGVFAVHGSRRLRRIAIAALALTLGVRWIADVQGEAHHGLVIGSHLLIAAYMLFLEIMCITAVLRREQITLDTVLGAVCGYLLIAYLFTFVFAAVEDATPGSFASNMPLPESDAAKIGRLTPELMYFSFVTLTSVGYGDIVPVSRPARSLAVLEMLSGQLYLAAFVARLVGVMQVRHSRAEVAQGLDGPAESGQEPEP